MVSRDEANRIAGDCRVDGAEFSGCSLFISGEWHPLGCYAMWLM
jgi:hypothetical protein